MPSPTGKDHSKIIIRLGKSLEEPGERDHEAAFWSDSSCLLLKPKPLGRNPTREKPMLLRMGEILSRAQPKTDIAVLPYQTVWLSFTEVPPPKNGRNRTIISLNWLGDFHLAVGDWGMQKGEATSSSDFYDTSCKNAGMLETLWACDIIMGYHGILSISTALLDFFQQLMWFVPLKFFLRAPTLGPRLKSFWRKLGARRPPFSAVNQTKVVGRYHLGLQLIFFLKSLQLPVGEHRFFFNTITGVKLMCIQDPHVHPQFHLPLLLPWCQRTRVMWRRRPRNEARRRKRLPSLHWRAWPTVKPQPLKETMVKRDKKNPRSGWGADQKTPPCWKTLSIHGTMMTAFDRSNGSQRHVRHVLTYCHDCHGTCQTC